MQNLLPNLPHLVRSALQFHMLHILGTPAVCYPKSFHRAPRAQVDTLWQMSHKLSYILEGLINSHIWYLYVPGHWAVCIPKARCHWWAEDCRRWQSRRWTSCQSWSPQGCCGTIRKKILVFLLVWQSMVWISKFPASSKIPTTYMYIVSMMNYLNNLIIRYIRCKVSQAGKKKGY